MADIQKYINMLAPVVRKYPRDGGPRPTGMLILQRGNRRIPLDTDVPHFSDDSTVPEEVAEILLGMQFDNKKAVVSAFNAAEAVVRRYGWNLSFEDEAQLGAYCLSCLIKSKLYRPHNHFRNSEYWLVARDKAVLEFPESDNYTSHQPFPKWESHIDDGGRQLIKPSHPQLKRTVWKPKPEEFFGRGVDEREQELTIPEYRLTKEDRWGRAMPSTWVMAINQLESNAYRINPVMLELLNIIGDDPKKIPSKKDPKLEKERKAVEKKYTRQRSGEAWKNIRSKKRRTIEYLDELLALDKAQDKERKDNRQPKLEDDDTRRYITPEQKEMRGEYWSERKAVESAIEAVATKHNEFVKIRQRANELEDKVFYQRGFLDYRGRMYLSRCVISYQGGDLQRSLVEFAKGKTVRKADMKWLWIHLANTYGAKGTPDEREQAAKKLKKKFLRWGKNPAKTYNEWEKECTDDKWQCIRACIELAALDKNPKFKSTLICEIDQSTSCLQHIALIMGDEDLAQQVNMGAEYHDVYSDVAASLSRLSDIPRNHSRKIVKTAMVAWTYGGTKWTACQAYHKSDIDYVRNLSARDRYWLADEVINAIELRFSKAVDYTQGMKRRAKLATEWMRSDVKHLKWKTPSQFTVHHYVQNFDQYRPYVFLREKREGEGKQPFFRITAKNPRADHNLTKIVKSAPPNYVHSVDASIIHWLLAGFSPQSYWAFKTPKSEDLNISCVTVHDAMGTHIRDVKRVGELFRSHLAYCYQILDPVKLATNAKTPITPRISHDWCKQIIASPYVVS